MAESHLSRSNHLGKTLQRGNRLVSTSVSVFIMTAILMAGGGLPGLSLRASAQSPMSPTQTPTTGDRATGREYGDEQSRKASLVKQGSQRAMAIPSTSELADILPFPGATTGLISINQAGNATGNDDSYNKAISEDADKVAFDSYASDLVSGIDNPADPTTHRLLYSQVFLHTISYGLAQTIQLSLQKDDTPKGGDQKSAFPTISGDGKWVSWVAHATNLVDNVGLTSGYGQVYLRDLANSITTIITKTTDGTTIAFRSSATNLDQANLTLNQNPNIYLASYNSTKKRWAPILISHLGGTSANAESNFSALSSDGRYLAFSSTASNLVANDNCGAVEQPANCRDIFLYDRVNLTIELISLSTAGSQANKESYLPSISGDGRYVAFDSVATNLMAPSIKMVTPWDNVYMRDRGVEPPKPVQMSLDQTALNFGDLGLNGTKLLTLTITSVGSSDLTVNPGSLTINDMGAFNIASQTCAGKALPKGQSCTITMAYIQPMARGFWTGGLLITSNDATNPSINLRIAGGGSGAILNPAPDALDFGNLGAGRQSKSIDLSVTSMGTSDLQIGTVSLVGSPGIFAITSQGCEDQTLNYNASCKVIVTFTQPYLWGTWTGSLRFTSNDAEKPTLDVPVTGGGVVNVNLPIVFNK